MVVWVFLLFLAAVMFSFVLLTGGYHSTDGSRSNEGHLLIVAGRLYARWVCQVD